jgi:enamine deaminase RidA (YjgF/YER057c/UK114 family)
VYCNLQLVQNTANLGITITDTIIAEKEEMNQIMQANQVQNSTTEICGFNGALSNKIQEIFTNLSAAHEQLSSMVDETLSDMSDDLRSLIVLTENVEKSLYNADIFFYIMIVVTCFLALLIVAMLIGVWFSAKNISNCFTKCITRAIIWPLFIFFLVLAWLFATVFLAVQLGGADFCVDPDMYVAQFLKNNMHMFEGPVLGILLYYISGCTTIAPGVEALTDIAAQIKEIAISSHELLEEIGEKSTQDIIDICGLSEMRAEALINLSSVLHSSIHALDTGTTGLRKIFACSTFNPIYVTVVHSAVCVESVSGLRYIFASTMVISVFSSILVMLRAALYPVQEVTGDQHSRKCN